MKKILIISPTPTHPQNAGNKARIYKLALMLIEMNLDVHFAFIDFDKGADLEAMRRFWGNKFLFIPYHVSAQSLKKRIYNKIIKVLKIRDFYRWLLYEGKYGIDDLYDKNIDNYISKYFAANKFDAVIVEYVFFSKVLEKTDKSVLKIIDTHDIFTNRDTMFISKRIKVSAFYTTASQEAKGLNRANIIIAIQANEKKFFETITDKNIVAVGHSVIAEPPAPFRKKRRKLLFVGSKHQSNLISIEYFIREVFPIVLENDNDAELIIVGQVCEKIGEYKQCKKLGHITELQEVYKEADVVISPILTGTGIKIKNLEAMGLSKPLVTTTIGAEGMEEGIGEAFLIGDTPKEFADCITELFADDSLYERLSRKSYSFAQEYNTKVFKELKIMLTESRLIP